MITITGITVAIAAVISPTIPSIAISIAVVGVVIAPISIGVIKTTIDIRIVRVVRVVVIIVRRPTVAVGTIIGIPIRRIAKCKIR